MNEMMKRIHTLIQRIDIPQARVQYSLHSRIWLRIKSLFENENKKHLQQVLLTCKMQNILLFLGMNVPPQSAHIGLRSRMIGSLAPKLYPLPSTSPSFFGVLGFFLGDR